MTTTAARRIAKVLNEHRPMGGKCVFHPDGKVWAWYADNSHPPLVGDAVTLYVPDTRVTAREIQARLDG